MRDISSRFLNKSESRKNCAASCQNVPINCLLGRQVHLSGSPAETASSGQLNPAFSLWLQGYPTAWGRCAVRVMPSSRKSRRHLSPPIKR